MTFDYYWYGRNIHLMCCYRKAAILTSCIGIKCTGTRGLARKHSYGGSRCNVALLVNSHFHSLVHSYFPMGE